MIFIPVFMSAQVADNVEQNKTGLQKWQYSFVTSIYLTTMAVNKPYNIYLLDSFETQIINGVNIIFKGGESRTRLTSFFEYDLLFRINKHFTKNYFIGIEAGPCLKYNLRKEYYEDDGMNLKLGIETGYLVADDIYIILK